MSTPNDTPLTYNGYVSQIATMAVLNTTTTNGVVVGVDDYFNTIIPQMLNYAELRIQRDVDLLPSQTSLTYPGGSTGIAAGTNQFTISVNDFVTIQTIGVSSVAGTATTPLLPSTKEFLQNVYNDSSYTGPPVYFAPYGGDYATGGNTSNVFVFGPYADANYNVVVTGTQRLPSLYQFANPTNAATGTTFISTYLPDLLIMASMIYVSAYQRNFGRQSDDPAMAQSYESQYQALLKTAIGEEYRKKFQMAAWSSMSQAPATPTRG